MKTQKNKVVQILNIGLNISSELKAQGYQMTEKEIYTKTFKILKQLKISYDFGYCSKYNNDGIENVLKVYIENKKMGSNLISYISNLLYQDCISVFDVAILEGELIGPLTQNYGGEFNHNYFRI